MPLRSRGRAAAGFGAFAVGLLLSVTQRQLARFGASEASGVARWDGLPWLALATAVLVGVVLPRRLVWVVAALASGLVWRWFPGGRLGPFDTHRAGWLLVTAAVGVAVGATCAGIVDALAVAGEPEVPADGGEAAEGRRADAVVWSAPVLSATAVVLAVIGGRLPDPVWSHPPMDATVAGLAAVLYAASAVLAPARVADPGRRLTAVVPVAGGLVMARGVRGDVRSGPWGP